MEEQDDPGRKGVAATATAAPVTAGADPLAEAPVFARLDPASRAALVDGGRVVHLAAGERLFAQGERPDAMFAVLAGRLEAVDDDSGETIRAIGRGQVVGELAVLTGEPRSATVRARRDSRLLEVPKHLVEELLADQPAFALGLLGAMGAQLRASRAAEPPRAALPSTVALVAAGPGAPLTAATEALLAGMADGRRAALLERPADGDRAAAAETLDRLERDHDQVLLAAGAQDAEWTRFCLRQADRAVVLAGDPAGPPDPPLPAGLRGAYLLAGTVPPDDRQLARWREAVDPCAVLAAPGVSLADRAAALARRLTGRSVGVVLSGGGARGFAHIGALDALLAAGVVVDRVGGCSIGALIGGQFACGRSPDEMAALCRREIIEANPMRDYTIPLVSFVRGYKARTMLLSFYGERWIESLERDFYCVSSDMISSEVFVHRTGPLYRAVGASICLPALGPPVIEGDRLLLDGGLLDNFPIEPMTATGEGPVIALDVSAPFQPPAARRVRGRPRLRRLQDRIRATVVGEASGEHRRQPSLGETLMRAVTLGGADGAELAAEQAALVIAPEVQDVALLELERLDEVRERGRVAAERALDASPDWRVAAT